MANKNKSYEEATDEFEIATESTDSSTIYAASDRESARDALNNLIVAYELYTSPSFTAEKKHEQGQDQGQQEQEDEGRLVRLEFDPAELSEEVREEVRKRVGQRVRELKSAVEALEGRAHD
jgi:FMN phosphatase YigB (HAD superfamily)